MRIIKPWFSQPHDGYAAAADKRIEFLVSGASAIPASTRGPFIPTARTVGSPTKQGVAAQLTYSNSDYQKLTRDLPLTLITVGVVTGTLAVGSYPVLVGGTASGGSTRGGVELGVGGNLGAFDADVGRVYSVVRSNTYQSEQTLIKTTATVSAGQIIVAMQRITPTLHELFVDGVGSASTATIAAPGANNSDTLKLGTTSGAAAAYVMAHSRLTRYVTDAEWAQIKSNVWRELSAPRHIWVPVSAAGGSTSLTLAEASHAHAADNLVLTSATSLTIADASHAHAADNVSLDTAASLAVQDAGHAHAANGLTLTTASTLAVAEAGHAHAADNLTLEALTGTSLVVDDAGHAHAADAPTLSVSSWLAVADAWHVHGADNLDLSGDFGAATIGSRTGRPLPSHPQRAARQVAQRRNLQTAVRQR